MRTKFQLVMYLIGLTVIPSLSFLIVSIATFFFALQMESSFTAVLLIIVSVVAFVFSFLIAPVLYVHTLKCARMKVTFSPTLHIEDMSKEEEIWHDNEFFPELETQIKE